MPAIEYFEVVLMFKTVKNPPNRQKPITYVNVIGTRLSQPYLIPRQYYHVEIT